MAGKFCGHPRVFPAYRNGRGCQAALARTHNCLRYELVIEFRALGFFLRAKSWEGPTSRLGNDAEKCSLVLNRTAGPRKSLDKRPGHNQSLLDRGPFRRLAFPSLVSEVAAAIHAPLGGGGEPTVRKSLTVAARFATGSQLPSSSFLNGR